jgi:3-deoxy-D-manno-octulosonic-acid transferase
MLRLIYSFFFAVALPFIFIKLYLRGKKAPDYRKRWKERLGFCGFKLKSSIWIHSVSMGESIAVAPLVKKLISVYPQKYFVITTMTPTGSAQVKKIYKDYSNVYHSYLPYDLKCLLNRFINKIKPELAIVVETELWPNMLHACRKKGVKTLLTNARLSQKSANGYKKVSWVTRMMLNNIDQIAAQSKDDADRFIDIGYPTNQCHISGNLKYDIQPEQKTLLAAKEFKENLSNRKIWIAASTHQGEDEVMLNAQREILSKFPDALLILVPRHPERFSQVSKLSQAYGFNVVRRSSGDPINSAQVFIGDSMGEMMFYYALSDVVFTGGSLIEHGGQNMLEPAALKKPILAGEHLFNFAQVSKEMIESGGLIIVHNATQIAERVALLFDDLDLSVEQGLNAYKIIERNQGALQKQFDIATTLIN